MDYENDTSTNEYEPELAPTRYYISDMDYDEDDNFEDDSIEDKLEYVVIRHPRWTPQQVIFILIAVILIAAILVFVILPWIQFTVAPTPLYMPPPSTPLSRL